MTPLRIGTRQSALAQTQAKTIADFLTKAFPDTRVELVYIKTKGDIMPSSRPVVGPGSMDLPAGRQVPPPTTGGDDDSGGLKAMFTKEIEDALLAKRIDLAVHSLKDMAVDLPKGLEIGAVPEREDARDVWISKSGTPFEKLPQGAKIGTGSTRRKAQLKNHRPDLELIDMRGNVDTRLTKLKDGPFEGIILAMAGLKRLGREKEATEALSSDILLPAVGQGSLAIECRLKDSLVSKYLKALDHTPSHQAALAERAFLKSLGGSCQTPIAGFAEHEDGHLFMRGVVLTPDGTQALRAKEQGRPFDAAGVGERLAAQLIAAGADRLLRGEKGEK